MGTATIRPSICNKRILAFKEHRATLAGVRRSGGSQSTVVIPQKSLSPPTEENRLTPTSAGSGTARRICHSNSSPACVGNQALSRQTSLASIL
jgi:hypothetical protein